MPPWNTRIAKAWSLDDMNKHSTSLKAVDYGEMQSAKSMKETVGYDGLRFQFQQRDVQLGNLAVSVAFEDQDSEPDGVTPHGRQVEAFRDSYLTLAY